MNGKSLSPDERAELDALMAMSDDDIDTDDIPELSEEKWATARRGAFHRPHGQPVTIRLDPDVVAWFQSHTSDADYQTEINRILRQHVMDLERKLA